MTQKIQAKIKDHKFQFASSYDETAFRNQLASLEGQEIDLSLDKRRKSRSINQNRYYFGYILPTFCKELGYYNHESAQLHELLKEMFLGQKVYNRLTKTRRKIVRSTADLNTLEFEDYLSTVRTYASAEHNIPLLLPNQIEMF